MVMPMHNTDLSFSALRAANTERINNTPFYARTRQWGAAEWCLSIMGELGEAANLIKKVYRGDFTFEDRRKAIEDELADVIIYVDLLARRLGINLGAVVARKFNEVSERVGSPVRL